MFNKVKKLYEMYIAKDCGERYLIMHLDLFIHSTPMRFRASRRSMSLKVAILRNDGDHLINSDNLTKNG